MNELATYNINIPAYTTEKVFNNVGEWFNGLSETNQTTVACTALLSFAGIVIYGIHRGCGFKRNKDGSIEITSTQIPA